MRRTISGFNSQKGNVMATEPTPDSTQPPPQPWFARLGLSGKLLLLGAGVGIISAFLPLITASSSMSMMGISASTSASSMVVQAWQGTLSLIGYLAAVALVFVLYPAAPLSQKNIAWAAAGVGALVLLLGLWLLIAAINASGSTGVMGFGEAKVSPGFGAFINLIAAAVVAVGGFLKVREEKLI
jgi:hypothetical protein